MRIKPSNLGKVTQPLRIAVSGGTVSPPIFDTLAILGKDSTLNRIRRCIDTFSSAEEPREGDDDRFHSGTGKENTNEN